MKFTEIEEDILSYIIKFREGLEGYLPPSMLTLAIHFEEVYERGEIMESISSLISSGVIQSFSFHSYLDLTETFKSRESYNILKNKILDDQKNGNENK